MDRMSHCKADRCHTEMDRTIVVMVTKHDNGHNVRMEGTIIAIKI